MVRAQVSTPGDGPSGEYTVISPSFRVPLGLAVIDLALVAAHGPLPLEIFILFLAGFLLKQANALRLKFTPDSMELHTLKEGVPYVIRSFPYSEWLNWRVFWPAFPVIVYWKETKSPHFMPMLFDPAELKKQLEKLPQTE